MCYEQVNLNVATDLMKLNYHSYQMFIYLKPDDVVVVNPELFRNYQSKPMPSLLTASKTDVSSIQIALNYYLSVWMVPSATFVVTIRANYQIIEAIVVMPFVTIALRVTLSSLLKKTKGKRCAGLVGYYSNWHCFSLLNLTQIFDYYL